MLLTDMPTVVNHRCRPAEGAPPVVSGPPVETRRVDLPGWHRYVVFVGGLFVGRFSARIAPSGGGMMRVEPFRVFDSRDRFVGFAHFMWAAVALLGEDS